MKQTIQLRLGQSLTMTPQLQQAIRLLQLSTLDLQAEIQQALEENPMLEQADESSNDSDTAEGDWEGGEAQGPEDVYNAGKDNVSSLNNELSRQNEQQQTDHDEMRTPDAELQANIPDELPVDSVWEDTYDIPIATSSGSQPDMRGSEGQDRSSETLREHLLWQMRLSKFSDKDMEIATAIIDAINEHGYLASTFDEILESISGDYEVDIEEIEAVLHRVQNFDPVGVGARDLRECLLIQLSQLESDTPWLEGARKLVTEHLQILASRDYTQLMRRMKYTQDELRQVINLVQSLNPRPGSLIASKAAEYIVPDVFVKKDNDTWRVELNSEAIPRIRINSHYAQLVKRADNSSDNTYLRNHLQEARWFIKSLKSRNETLLKVASCIVERQRDFLEYGEEAMKALVLHDVAEVVEMHESTISRVTTQKYMHTPRGIFELKYFLSSHVSTEDGGECSATAIRALLKKLIAAEDPRKPLSDSKLAQILADQGIRVARRTIAKYRESITIPSSNERKRLA
jgi:RNA polymerase sigma-54 factor